MSTLFKGPCIFCGAMNYPLAACGENVCSPRCDTAISIAGIQPPDVTFDQYKALVREVSGIVGLFPQLRRENSRITGLDST
jgi:hypothetical protein